MKNVRVRFCPSPTGVPHVGLIRTALFNWAYARRTGGTFVFRIEDTDDARDSEESYAMLVEALSWLDISWDEGVEKGGPHGPYRQSQRTGFYREVVDKLVAAGHAYPSYSTPEEVEARHIAAGRNPKLGYDNFDRNLTPDSIAEYERQGRPKTLRFKMPDADIDFTDLIRGKTTFKAGTIPDFAITRGNGQPLYTLVNPVDDALMEITHVLRGEDLLSSTPRQLALHQALVGFGIEKEPPEFGHLPYVMGQGNKKLSKRDPESNLFLLRDRGFIREGLINYLALLGWSIDGNRDIFTPQEFAENFDVKDVLKNPARFDVKKAAAINGTHIRMLKPADFEERLVGYLQQHGVVGTPPDTEERRILQAVAPLIQERVALLEEAVPMVSFFFTADDAITVDHDALKGIPEAKADILEAAITALAGVETWEAAAIKEVLSEALITGRGLKPRTAFASLRVAVSGRRVSPPLFESMEILGKRATMARLERGMEIL